MSSGRVAKDKTKSSAEKRRDADAVPLPARKIKTEHSPMEVSIEKERDPSVPEKLDRPVALRAGNEENHDSANHGTRTMRPQVPRFICKTERSPFRSPVPSVMNFAPVSSAFRQFSPAYSSLSVRQMATPSTAGSHLQLYSAPLLQTPLDAHTPHCSVPTGVSATKGAFFCPMTSTKSSHNSPSPPTPGLDLLADQSLVHRPHHPGHPFLVNRTTTCSFGGPYHQRTYPDHGRTHIPPNCPPRPIPQPLLQCSNPGHPLIPGNVSEKLTTVKSLEKASTGTSNRVPKKKDKKPVPQYQPPLDPVMMYPLLFREAKTSPKPCQCKNSKCLKLYCNCFHKGLLCDPNFCNCKDCSNTEAHNGAKGPREYAILKMLAKTPDAFTLRVKKPDMCACPKTNCLKRYCECFSASRHCTGRCKCTGCSNWPRRVQEAGRPPLEQGGEQLRPLRSPNTQANPLLAVADSISQESSIRKYISVSVKLENQEG